MSITIYDIAAEAKVSIATVSRVFNEHPRVSEATRQRVFDVAQRLNYEPHVSARSLARKNTHLVSAVIPMMTNYFFLEVLQGLQDTLASSDFDLLVYAAQAPEDVDAQLFRAVQKGRAEGLLVFSTPLTDERVERIQSASQPVVLVDAFHPEFDSVSVDNQQGGYIATRHFLDLGYEKIGLIMANSISVPAAERRSGYERALIEAGRPVNESLIAVSTDEKNHGYSEEAGYEAMLELLKRRVKPEAVFVASDIQALGVLHAISESGLRVPHDVAVIGFDDVKISRYVKLTTLKQPMYEMGKLAIEKLLVRIQYPDRATSHTLFSPRLVVRETCGAFLRTTDGEVHAH